MKWYDGKNDGESLLNVLDYCISYLEQTIKEREQNEEEKL